MTLSYWWKHWFWITLPFYFVRCESSTTELSPLEDSNAFKNHTTKFITIQNLNASNKTNSIIPTKIQKTSPKKVDFIYLNMTKSNTTTIRTTIASTVSTTTIITPIKPITTNKNTTVIKEDDSGIIDSQLSNITLPINHTENILYTESDYNNNNQSFLFNINDNNININNSYNNCSNDDTGNLSAAGITGITLGCVIIVGVICGISYFLYHNRGSNRPQVLNDRCSNPDSSGYIDDASVRDNSEEMYSLDNDSFLNSLEAMTIQNYWTDTVKHTKL